MCSGFSLLLLLLLHIINQSLTAPNAKSPEYVHVDKETDSRWFSLGKEELERAIQQNSRRLENRAKNVIVFIGDGMGISTVTASRLLMAQEQKIPTHQAKLSWEHFPSIGLSKTYNTDKPVPDSAATATAILTGQKANEGTAGVNENVARGDCDSVAQNKIKSMFNYAEEQGKGTGLVTTTRVTHATPSAAYAHSAERNWEADSDLPEDAKGKCWDIARQLIDNEENENIQVMFAGGRKNFLPNDTFDPEDIEILGERADGRNLLEEWLDKKKVAGLSESEYKMIMNLTQFNELDTDKVKYVMGLFAADHIGHEARRSQDKWGTPSLTQMVETSINILKNNENGYFLLVEEGHIDWAHHANMAHMAVNDTLAMSDAVQRAADMTSEEDTLIIVTADHSHAFVIAGYPLFSTDLLTYDEEEMMADDGKPFQTFSYINGPGYLKHRTESGSIQQEITRKDISTFSRDELRDVEYVSDAGYPMVDESHGGEDVAVYARGPWAHLLHATHEQSYIGHVMMFATCVPPYDENPHCRQESPAKASSAAVFHGSSTVNLFVTAAFIFLIETKL